MISKLENCGEDAEIEGERSESERLGLVLVRCLLMLDPSSRRKVHWRLYLIKSLRAGSSQMMEQQGDNPSPYSRSAEFRKCATCVIRVAQYIHSEDSISWTNGRCFPAMLWVKEASLDKSARTLFAPLPTLHRRCQARGVEHRGGADAAALQLCICAAQGAAGQPQRAKDAL
eukprot:604320-Pleurochrysis_carterae.AAC.1